MLYVGLDIHDKRIAICVLLGETGQIVRRAQVRTIDEMMRLFEALLVRFEVCYEASCGYGHYHDLLSPTAARVTVAHPGRLRLIFRSKDKDDRKDAVLRLRSILGVGARTAKAVFGSIDDPDRYREPGPGHTGSAGRRLSRSRSRAGSRSHPEVRRGALRRRGVE
jgi:hypothetical protein